MFGTSLMFRKETSSNLAENNWGLRDEIWDLFTLFGAHADAGPRELALRRELGPARRRSCASRRRPRVEVVHGAQRIFEMFEHYRSLTTTFDLLSVGRESPASVSKEGQRDFASSSLPQPPKPLLPAPQPTQPGQPPQLPQSPQPPQPPQPLQPTSPTSTKMRFFPHQMM